MISNIYFHQEISKSFLNRFQNSIPPSVICSLTNEKLDKGRYSINEGLLFDLTEIVRMTKLDHDDTVLFTYCGSGHFDLVVFDRERMEKTVTEAVVAIGKPV